MTMVFMLLGVLSIVGGAIWAIAAFVEHDASGWAGVAVVIIGILLIFSANNLDKPRAFDGNHFKSDLGYIKAYDTDTITIGETSFSYGKKFEDTIKQLKIGDPVKADYAEGGLYNYLVSIEKFEGGK
jgi:hypothetical protein